MIEMELMDMREPHTGLDALARDPKAAGLLKNKALLQDLARSPDAQALMGLLNQKAGGGLQNAAQSAAKGDLSALTKLVKQVAESDEGAQLMRQLNEQIGGAK